MLNGRWFRRWVQDIARSARSASNIHDRALAKHFDLLMGVRFTSNWLWDTFVPLRFGAPQLGFSQAGWAIRDTWNPGDFCMGYTKPRPRRSPMRVNEIKN
jgi:hypothetical protein